MSRAGSKLLCFRQGSNSGVVFAIKRTDELVPRHPPRADSRRRHWRRSKKQFGPNANALGSYCFSFAAWARKTERAKPTEGRTRVGAATTYEQSEFVSCAEPCSRSKFLLTTTSGCDATLYKKQEENTLTRCPLFCRKKTTDPSTKPSPPLQVPA